LDDGSLRIGSELRLENFIVERMIGRIIEFGGDVDVDLKGFSASKKYFLFRHNSGELSEGYGLAVPSGLNFIPSSGETCLHQAFTTKAVRQAMLLSLDA
jgi:hypothetical protein